MLISLEESCKGETTRVMRATSNTASRRERVRHRACAKRSDTNEMEDAESRRTRDSMEKLSGPRVNTRQVMSIVPGEVPGLALAVRLTPGEEERESLSLGQHVAGCGEISDTYDKRLADRHGFMKWRELMQSSLDFTADIFCWCESALNCGQVKLSCTDCNWGARDWRRDWRC